MFSNIHNLSLVFMFICIIALFVENKNIKNDFKNIENFGNQDIIEHSSNTNNTIKELINQQYDMDIEAIRNLGAISKSLLTGKNYHNTTVTTPGKLIIPADVEIQGAVTMNSTLNILPKGSIVIWVYITIPEGWRMCNGSHGTPDLRGRFPIGLNNTQTTKHSGFSTYEHKKIGGSETHRLSISEMPLHSHNYDHRHFSGVNVNSTTRGLGGDAIWGRVASANAAIDLDDGKTEGNEKQVITSRPLATTYTGGTDLSTDPKGSTHSHNNMPPYIALHFIMKM